MHRIPSTEVGEVTIVLDCIRKAQNLGAVMRLVLASNADVYLTGDSLKHTHPKVKTQMQKWARLPNFADVETLIDVKYADTLDELVNDFRAEGYRIIGASPHAEVIYTDIDYTTDDFIIVFGPEVSGLSRRKLEMMDTVIKIPMLGNVDSLNLATSVAIVIYEVLRQRGFRTVTDH
jgi:tRNA G18 (ribose-2'-O)-methylase SpoU